MAQLLDIVTTAAILYAVAAGLLIVFGVMKIINFAHGGFLTIGGYSALIVTRLGWNPWWSLGFAVVIGVV
jgi:urea transport system permease protein